MSDALRRPMTAEEFLAWEEAQDLRWEFDGVRPVAMTGGSALTTGICDTEYSCRISMASRTVSVGWVCTSAGRSPAFLWSTSPTVVSVWVCMKP